MVPITQDEAREALADIDQVARQIRRAVAGSEMGGNLLLWGAIWIAGFTLSYLFPWNTGRIWMTLALFGMGGSALMGFLHHRRGLIRSEQARKLMGQIALFWLVVIAYAIMLGLLIPMKHGVDRLLLIVCIIMLAYVVMGIWLRSPLLAIIGLAVTAAAMVGRFWLATPQFMLWMAVFGGGGLFLPGLCIKLQWK